MIIALFEPLFYRSFLTLSEQYIKPLMSPEEAKALKRGKKPGETEQQFKRKVEHLLSEELGATLNESPDLSKKQLYDAAQVLNTCPKLS